MAIKGIKKRPLLIVDWDDITTHHTWEDEAKDCTNKGIHCCSVGWKLKSNSKTLILTPMRTDLGDCSDRQIIPKGVIRNIRRVE